MILFLQKFLLSILLSTIIFVFSNNLITETMLIEKDDILRLFTEKTDEELIDNVLL